MYLYEFHHSGFLHTNNIAHHAMRSQTTRKKQPVNTTLTFELSSMVEGDSFWESMFAKQSTRTVVDLPPQHLDQLSGHLFGNQIWRRTPVVVL